MSKNVKTSTPAGETVVTQKPTTFREIAAMSKEEREEWLKNNPIKPRNWRDDLPPLSPDQVVRFAIDSAHKMASDLYDGLKILEALGGEDESVEIAPDTMKWLAVKFKNDAGEIMEHMDYAQTALKGHVYDGAPERYRKSYEEEAAR